MPSVTLRYRPIQYVEDPFCGDTRNIGVIAYDCENAYFRIMGGTDGALFAALSKTAAGSSWAFTEWVEWFRTLAGDFKEQPESMLRIVESLFNSDLGIAVGKEAEIDGVDSDKPDEAIEWLYSRLVKEPTLPRNRILRAKIENLLHVTEIKYRKGFEYDIEVEFIPEGAPPIRVQLPYAIIDSPRAVFKIVRFQTGGAALARQVNDAIMTLGSVVEHGFAEKSRCVVLTDKPPRGRDGELRRLSEYGVVIDVTGDNTTSQLKSIFLNQPTA